MNQQSKEIAYFIIPVIVISLLIFMNPASAFTEITENNSLFGGNVTADMFFEVDGTYVIPIYKVNWSDGVNGDLEGIGLNATVNKTSLFYAINISWYNITDAPTNLSFFNNDVGYITDGNTNWDNTYSFITLANLSGQNISLFFNDVGYITLANLTLYENLSQFLNDVGYITLYNLTGQNISLFFNDAGYITLANLTLYENLSQFFNDVGYITLYNLSGQNISLFLNDVGYITNANLTLYENLSQFYNDVGYITTANLTLYENLSQFYNDVGYITLANLTLYENLSQFFNDVGYITLFNLSGQNISLFTNDVGYITLANISYPITQGDGVYTYNTTSGNITTIHFNETKLNQTIAYQTGIFEENVTVTVSGGTGTAQTSICCYDANEILEIAVYPATITNVYRFSANTSVTNEVVDGDKKTHVGNWIVGHAGLVVTNQSINYTIYNAVIDESFRVRVRWQK